MKEILSNQLLSVLKKKLSGSSSRSIHINAIPSTSRVKLQALDLNKLSKKDIFKEFIEKLTSSANLKFNLSFDNLDSDKHKKTLNRLKYLSRQNKDYFLEHGLEPFGFGYPIVAKRDLKNSKKVIYSPLLIWNLELLEDSRKINSFQISRSEDSPVKINEVLLNYIESIDKVTFEKLPKEFLDDGVIDLSEIQILTNNFLSSFSSDQQIDSDFFNSYFDLNTAKEFENEITEVPIILNSGVFGLYLSQKESIINDIELLKKKRVTKEYTLSDYEENPFSPVITDQSQQQILSSLKTNNKFVIHGPPGTGKSQTLTATLSSALRNNKTCLVVCEKKTALDVIQENLNEVGLGEYTILIEDPVRDRRKVVGNARDIIEKNESELEDLKLRRNIKFDKGTYSASSIRDKHEKNLNIITDKIKKLQDVKNTLDSEILDGNNFKGVLEKINFEFDYLNFEKKYDLSKTKLVFKDKEYLNFLSFFDKLNLILFDVNPFDSFYDIVDESLFLKNDYNSFEVFLNEKTDQIIEEITAIKYIFDSNQDFRYKKNKDSLEAFVGLNLNMNLESFYKELSEFENLLISHKEKKIFGVIFKIKKNFNKDYRELDVKINKYKNSIKHLNICDLSKVEIQEKPSPLELINSIHSVTEELKLLQENNSIYEAYISQIHEINQLKVFKENTQLFDTGLEIVNSIVSLEINFGKIIDSKSDFECLKEFSKLYNRQSKKNKRILFLFVTENNFESQFKSYYYRKILNANNIGTVPDNGFPQDLYGISDDLINIHEGSKWSTIVSLKELRKNTITEFKNKNNIKLEQLFSKRSSSKNRKLSLRSIVDYDFDLFSNFFPIVLTNPTTVSSLFPLTPNLFDIVLFDEASQLRIEDTVPSLYRAKVKIVSGDQKQMPPSSYFSSVEIEDTGDDDDMLSDVDYAFKESLLEFSVDAGFENIYLDMHYRSKHPDLIEFSNRAFYNGRLVALPAAEDYTPIEFYQVNSLYENRTNRGEALEIVNYLKETAKVNESVGIATFNLDQRNLIMDEINSAIQDDKVFSDKMLAIESNDFFVKNLENIQGDERDVIIISTTFGLDKENNFKQFFGPVNNKNKGHKLLNVIVTRAKKRMVIMSSIPENYYLNFADSLEKEGLIGKAVFYSYLSYSKAIASNDEALRLKVLSSLDKYADSTITKESGNSTGDLSLKIKNDLTILFGGDYEIEIGFNLGGYNYDLCVFRQGVPLIVIDIDGKRFYNNQDDYLFDLGRKNISVNTGILYYRLWSSNYYNSREKEIKRIKEVVEKKLNSIVE